ncbi:hypothetical protein R6Q59_002866 [Mikania micrantha]
MKSTLVFALLEEFNANFATLINLVTSTMTDDKTTKKTTSEKLKNVIVEIVNFNLSIDYVF